MQSVLVVEDDASIRVFIEVILKIEGFSVFTAATAAEALDIVSRVSIDLVTIDLGLPDMSGAELAARLRALPACARARQMIVSGSVPTPEQAALVDAVLSKPFDFATFTDVLKALAAHPASDDRLAAELDRIIAGRLIFPHYQPIVHLDSGRIVGFEALARGPADSPLHTPDALFAEAHRRGRLIELDKLCSVAAAERVAEFETEPELVFINVEPGTVAAPLSPEWQRARARPRGWRLVAEYTERAVTRALPALLKHAEFMRARGDLVALDDLGCDPCALAMLPLIQPEIVKLDLSVVHGPLTATAATVAAAVADYAGRGGALVVAEGIESEEQLASARALGATLGQGFLFGRPAPPADWRGLREPRRITVTRSPRREPRPPGLTPFGCASRAQTPRPGGARFVLGLSQQLASQVSALGELAATFVLLRDYALIPATLREAFLATTRQTAILGLLGVGITGESAPAAYVADLDPAEPMAREWAAVVLGPHQATVLCARETSHEPDVADRCFEFVLSHDHELAVEVASLLAHRLTPRVTMTRTTALPPPLVG